MRNLAHRRVSLYSGLALAVLAYPTALAAQATAVAPVGVPSLPVASPSGPGPPAAAAAATDQPPAANAAATLRQVDPTELILFSLELDSLTLSDSLTAYGAPEDPLVPIGELARLLELDIDVIPAERRIVGRVGAQRRSVAVDLASGQVRVGTVTFNLAAGDAAITDGEVYLRAQVAAKILPLTFAVDSEALSIKLAATEQLPIQGRLERLARLRDSANRGDAQDEVLTVETPYRLLTLPAFDVVGAAGVEATTATRFPFRYDMRVAGDLFWSGYQGYLGSDDKGIPTSARLTFERRSLQGRLLGPLKARLIGLGDVYTPGLSIGPRSVGGRGVSLSTVPLDQTNIFNRVDLRGELPIGYDVELYVNDVLASGQDTPTQGRYEFLNVPLARGINVIRIVSYGPRGERGEQTKVVNVGGGQLRPGEMTLELGVVQQETPLIRVREAQPEDVLSDGQGGLRAVATVNLGVTQFLTMSAGAAYYPPNNDTQRQVYTLGARTSLFGVLTQIDSAVDNLGGAALAVSLAYTFRGTSLVGRHAEFQGGFFDENGPSAELTDPILRRSELTVDTSLPLFDRIIPATIRGLRTEYVDGVVDVSGSARGSTTIANILVSGGVEYQNLKNPTGDDFERLSGYFSGSTFRDFKWQLRATLDYDLLPTPEARSLAITADRDINESLSLRLGVSQSLSEFKSVSLTGSLIYRRPWADMAVSADYNNSDRSWRVGAQASFGLAFDRSRGRYIMTRPGPGGGGTVLFHAFIDANANGLYDPGETPVSDVVIEGGESRAATGKDGKVFLPSVGAGPTARLNVGLDRVDNTFLKAPPSAVQIQPRAGSYTEVLYPMRPTGEVLVKIMLKRPDGARVGLSAVQVRLVDPAGKVAAEAGTEFDGTTIFQEVPLGTYKIQLEPTQATRLRMKLNSDISVTIRGDGAFTPDVEAEVSFEPRPTDTP